jgi:hypothetical protein
MQQQFNPDLQPWLEMHYYTTEAARRCHKVLVRFCTVHIIPQMLEGETNFYEMQG